MDKIVFIAPHHPQRDPRVDWTAQFIHSPFEKLVIGIDDGYEPKALPSGYGMSVHPARSLPWAYKELLKILITGKTRLWVKPVLLLGLIAAVALMPLAIIANIVLNYLKFFLRPLAESFFFRFLRPLSARIAAKVWSPQTKKFVRLFFRIVPSYAATLYNRVSQIEGVKVVYCHDLLGLGAGVLLKIKNKNLKLVYDAHEYWPFSDPEASRLQILAWHLYEKAAVYYCDACLTVTPQIAQLMSKAYKKEFYTVPNAEPFLSSQPFPSTSERSAWLQRFRPTLNASQIEEHLIFLFQGNFTFHRGIEELLREWSEANIGDRASLILRGPFNESSYAFEKLADDLGILNKTVFFMPPVPEHELVKTASWADIGVIPYKPNIVNYQFCCPNKLSQYMQAGLAILSNNLDYVKSIVTEGNIGKTYDSSTSGSLARTVTEMADSREKLAVFKLNSLKFAREHFNWQQLSKPIDKLIATQEIQ